MKRIILIAGFMGLMATFGLTSVANACYRSCGAQYQQPYYQQSYQQYPQNYGYQQQYQQYPQNYGYNTYGQYGGYNYAPATPQLMPVDAFGNGYYNSYNQYNNYGYNSGYGSGYNTYNYGTSGRMSIMGYLGLQLGTNSYYGW